MAKSHFETIIEPLIADCARRALECPAGDMLKHAMIKGEAMGLQTALVKHREAIRRDIDPDEDREAA